MEQKNADFQRKTPEVTCRIPVSPYARKTAGQMGIDLRKLAGTGPGGRILWRDVQAAADRTTDFPTDCIAAYRVTAQVEELLAGLETLGGALSWEEFVRRMAARLVPDMTLRFAEAGVECAVPCLRGGQRAALSVGTPREGWARLHLAFVPSVLSEDSAADILRNLRNILENPLSLL